MNLDPLYYFPTDKVAVALTSNGKTTAMTL
jgi:hypothetical protein